jgi:hypothetical protein
MPSARAALSETGVRYPIPRYKRASMVLGLLFDGPVLSRRLRLAELALIERITSEKVDRRHEESVTGPDVVTRKNDRQL